MYDDFKSHFYDERYLKLHTGQIHFFVKKRLDKLENTDLITRWTHNMDTSAYLKKSQKEGFHKP